MIDTHCPDCGQDLAEPQRSIGYLGAIPIWCATCDGCHGTGKPLKPEPPKRAAGRPRDNDMADALHFMLATTFTMNRAHR